MSPTDPRRRTFGRVLAAIVAASALVAVAVRLFAAHAARDALGFTFPGVEPRPGQAAAIFLSNFGLQVVAFVGVLTLRAVRGMRDAREPVGRTLIAYRTIFDVLLAAPVASSVVVVGAGIGAYGEPMVRALLPHGPVELAAFALTLTLYLDARRVRRPLAQLLAPAAAATALLAAAALLETYLSV
jgi:hypothetical protein